MKDSIIPYLNANINLGKAAFSVHTGDMFGKPKVCLHFTFALHGSSQ